MKYKNIVEGRFIDRPNRFIAHVNINGENVVCHVKNTGRCKELLVPDATVYLEHSDNPSRKTQYDLVAVQKGELLVNMDSQSPNQAVLEALPSLFPDAVKIQPEYTHGDSRFDFHLEFEDHELFIEVKGVTLERDRKVLFPDAPTQRGSKHLKGLIRCVEEGHDAMILLVVQMKGVVSFSPNDETDPEFGKNIRMAAKSGVTVRCIDCLVTPDSMILDQNVSVIL